MYFRRIPASAITSHEFAVIFSFIDTTAVAYVQYLRWGIPSLHAALLDKSPPSFPMTNTALKGLVSQTQVSATVCEIWFGRVNTPLRDDYQTKLLQETKFETAFHIYFSEPLVLYKLFGFEFSLQFMKFSLVV